jgi:hypothetical protein
MNTLKIGMNKHCLAIKNKTRASDMPARVVTALQYGYKHF